MSEHSSSLVATFKEKFRPKCGKSGGANNSRYIKENVYFNGIALRESLLHDNDYSETQTPNRLFTRDDKTIHANTNKRFELEKGCFIYQNPTSYCDDNDVIHKFTNMSLISEIGINSDNYSCSFDNNKTFKLVIEFLKRNVLISSKNIMLCWYIF